MKTSVTIDERVLRAIDKTRWTTCSRFRPTCEAGGPKSLLTDFVASLAAARLRALDHALRVALALG